VWRKRDTPKNYHWAERREWHLWVLAFIFTLLLTAGLVSFLLPSLMGEGLLSSSEPVTQVVRGLVCLVFLFEMYALYQQIQIRRIRRQLHEREEIFRLIGENVADLIAVVDTEGHRIYNSPSYERVLGYTLEELKATPSFQQIHPEDRERVKQASERARQTGLGATLEYRLLRKDGQPRFFESTSSVIRNARGVPEKLVIVNRDITDRKKTEESLRKSEASFRSIVEDAPYGIYRAGADGSLIRVNPALVKMLDYGSPEELLGVDPHTEIFRHPGECQRLNETLSREGECRDVEVDWKRKDGTPIIVRCSGRCVRGEQGAPEFFEIFAEDVTERRVLERQLRTAQKMEAIGRLSGGIAHDFNNLLGVIIGFGDVLKRKLGPDSPLLEHAEEIVKAGRRAAALTRQLLAFSRQQVLTPRVVNLNTLVTDMGKMLPRLIGEDISVSVNLASDLGQVKADPGQIEQVIMNLAVNARDAMPQGGRLEIVTANVELDLAFTRQHPGSKPGQYVMLSVSDTGIGMDPETQAHIFEPFFTTKEHGKGTGLGLATVYGIVKQSGGYILVESALGKGATFKFYLPRVYESLAAEEPAPASRPALSGTETILLVEDSDPLRKLAESFLVSHGFHVLVAEDGEKALAAVQRHAARIDLLLTDVVMPGINGRVLAERLSARQPGLRVLYMSGYSDSFIAGHGVLEPGTHLIHKPFEEEALVRAVRALLDAPRSRDSKTDANLAAPQPVHSIVS
jgi:PAS domain S-box-containing protein